MTLSVFSNKNSTVTKFIGVRCWVTYFSHHKKREKRELVEYQLFFRNFPFWRGLEDLIVQFFFGMSEDQSFFFLCLHERHFSNPSSRHSSSINSLKKLAINKLKSFHQTCIKLSEIQSFHPIKNKPNPLLNLK